MSTAMTDDFPSRITYGEKYGPAMELIEQADADAYWEKCVRHMMSRGHTREEAERLERGNLGYYAGYYDHETRVRVGRLFRCDHPVPWINCPQRTAIAKELTRP